MNNNRENHICYLCGEPIEEDSMKEELSLSMDHIPPRQFYPKSIRQQTDLNLEGAPSHKKCNGDYREDEEYFYHSLYPLVEKNNSNMAKIIFQDLERRTHKPQTPAMARKILKNVSRVTQGGIHLPPGKIEIALDESRLQRIAIKIARGVLALNKIPYISETSCFDIRICENESEVIELYKILWQISSVNGILPSVFSYKYHYSDGIHHMCLLFWEAFMYCLCFKGLKE